MRPSSVGGQSGESGGGRWEEESVGRSGIDTCSINGDGTGVGGNEHSSGGSRNWVVGTIDEGGLRSTEEDTGGGGGSVEHSDERLAEVGSESGSAGGEGGGSLVA